jgi:very-short-patch-repair endonuclease
VRPRVVVTIHRAGGAGSPLRRPAGQPPLVALTPDAEHLLRQQRSLVTRPQLLRVGGMTKGQIDAALRYGHLERYHHGTYRRTGAADDLHQEALAAALRCRPDARATGPRILTYLGVEGFDEDASFAILVPPGRRVRNVPFQVRTDLACGWGTATYGGVPGTSPALTLLELARGDGYADAELLLTFDRARWRGVVARERLLHAVAELPRHPGARRWAAMLGADASLVESPGERRLLPVLRRLSPAVEFQVSVAPGIRVDALWRAHAIVIEYRGGDVHDDPRDERADAERDARLRALGYTVVHVVAADLRHPDSLLARLQRIADAA